MVSYGSGKCLLPVSCGSRLAAAVIGTAAGPVPGRFGFRGCLLRRGLGLFRGGVLHLRTGLAAAIPGTGGLRLRTFGGLRLLLLRVVYDFFRAVAETDRFQQGLFLRLLPADALAAAGNGGKVCGNGGIVLSGLAAAQDGDIVNIDYKGTKDGEAFDGGTAEGQDLTLGSGSMIDGFEDGLVGAKKGETKTLDLTFPENYREESLAGQAVVFEVTVNAVKEKQEVGGQAA